MKRTIFFGAAAAALLVLSGCSDGSNAPGASVVVSDAVQDADIDAEISEQGFNSSVQDGVVIVDTAGSSTCPPTIESGTFADGVLTLQRHTYDASTACTMDYRLFRQEVSLSEGSFDDNVTVTVND